MFDFDFNIFFLIFVRLHSSSDISSTAFEIGSSFDYINDIFSTLNSVSEAMQSAMDEDEEDQEFFVVER